MTKDELLGKFQTVRNNYALVLGGMLLAREPGAADRFAGLYAQLNDVEYDFGYVEGVFRNADSHFLGNRELTKMVHRATVKELFELVKQYSQETGQLALLQAAPWYQFARIVRNCFSHNYRFEFRDYDLARLPVTWSGLTFTAAMDGTYLPQEGFLTRTKIWELVGDMRATVAGLA